MEYKYIVFKLEGTVLNVDSETGKFEVFDGIKSVLIELKNKNLGLGTISSMSREKLENAYMKFNIKEYFDYAVCDEDCVSGKFNPVSLYIDSYSIKKEEFLYIASSKDEIECAAAAGVDCALALWSDISHKHIRADYYLNQPYEIINLLDKNMDALKDKPWLRWAMELQFIAQAGLTYSKDNFDLERFERVREISAEILSNKTAFSSEKVKDIFCNEEGFQTPKVDTRAAIFKKDKILLVKEKDGLWSLPGGWVDVNQSIKSNTIKEVREEAGLEVVPVKLIAVHDRNLHNLPVYAYSIFKNFVLCEIIGGSFQENSETDASGFFALDELPKLASAKNSEEQIRMCFQAYKDKNWQTIFD